MANIFDPDKYFKNSEWKTAVDPAYSHYERLGFNFGDRLSTAEINEAFQIRYNWWNDKDKKARSGGHAHPVIKVVGTHISDAVKNLSESKNVLTDPNKKLEYDKRLKEDNNKKIEKDFLKSVRVALRDKILSQEEKSNLFHYADTLKIDGARAEEIISSEMKTVGATYKVEKSTHTPESFPDYYALLEIKQTANNTKIEAAHKKQYSIWNSRAANPKFRDDVSRMKKLLQDARDTLLDPSKRDEYERQLKESRKAPTSPPGGGTPNLEVDKSNFDFNNLRAGASSSNSFTISNIGGGALSGPIKANKKWLKVSQNNIDLNKHKQDITFSVDATGLPFGFKDTGIIEIQSNGGTEKVSVNLSVEMPEADLSRFRLSLTIGGLIIGALVGLMSTNITDITAIAALVALLSVVIAGGILGYKDGGVGTAIVWGVGTLIIGAIVFGILESYFSRAFSTIAWALTYSSFAFFLSTPIRKALWQGNTGIPIATGIVVLALTGVILIGGKQITLVKNKEDISTPPASEVSKEKKPTSSSKKKSKKEGSTANIPMSLSGTWDGYYINYGKKINFKLNLNQNGSSISGSTYETYEDGSYTANVNGDIRGNSINFVKNMDGRGFEPIEYVGTINNNKIRGKWIIKKTGVSGEWAATKRG